MLPILLGLVLVPQGTAQEQRGRCLALCPFICSPCIMGFSFPAQPPLSYCQLRLQLHFLRRLVPFSSHQTGHSLWIQHCYEKETIQCGAGWGNSPQEPLPVVVDLFYCWVLPPSTHKQVSHGWEGGPFLLHGFFRVKDPLELEEPSGLRSCPASISRWCEDAMGQFWKSSAGRDD